MNIEKLCEEFHEKIGKDKTVKITIEEGDTKNMEGWYVGQMRPEVVEELVNRTKTEKPKPFLKISKGNGIEYSYFVIKEVQEI